MKTPLILSYLFLCTQLYSQVTSSAEISIYSGISNNLTSTLPTSRSLGHQYGIRIKTPSIDDLHFQFRSSIRTSNYKTIEMYFDQDIDGSFYKASRLVTDQFKTTDFIVLFGAAVLTREKFHVNIIAGGGYGIINNTAIYTQQGRLNGLRKEFSFVEMGMEISFVVTERLLITINPQYFRTSFYRDQYGINESYQLNLTLTHRPFLHNLD